MCEHGPFNCDVIMQKEVTRLIKDFNIDEVVETGTCLGHSTGFLSKISTVHSIELSKIYYDMACEKFQGNNNVKLYLGDTRKELPKICDTISKTPKLFFLDAHGGVDPVCPLDVELATLSRTFKDNAIIIIDDFRVPGRDFFNDGFTVEWFRPHYKNCFTEYVEYFNNVSIYDKNSPLKDVKKGNGRLFLIPTALLKANNYTIDRFALKEGNHYYSNILSE